MVLFVADFMGGIISGKTVKECPQAAQLLLKRRTHIEPEFLNFGVDVSVSVVHLFSKLGDGVSEFLRHWELALDRPDSPLQIFNSDAVQCYAILLH